MLQRHTFRLKCIELHCTTAPRSFCLPKAALRQSQCAALAALCFLWQPLSSGWPTISSCQHPAHDIFLFHSMQKHPGEWGDAKGDLYHPSTWIVEDNFGNVRSRGGHVVLNEATSILDKLATEKVRLGIWRFRYASCVKGATGCRLIACAALLACVRQEAPPRQSRLPKDPVGCLTS